MPTARIKQYASLKCGFVLVFGDWPLITLRADLHGQGVRKHGSLGSADMIQFIGGPISRILLDF